jgi:hypothetical protein
LEIDIPWDELQSKMKENIEITVDESERTLKILLKGELPEGFPIQGMIQDAGGERLQQMSNMVMDEPINFETEVREDEKAVYLRFQDDESLQKMHEFLQNLFFGDGLKELMEKIMQVMFQAFSLEEPPEE